MTRRHETARPAPPSFPDETLVERLAQPSVLAAWLAQAECALAAKPQDAALALRRAGLLRALGRLEDAAQAYAELKTTEGDGAAAVLTGTATGLGALAGATRFVRLSGVLTAQERRQLWEQVGAGDARFDETRIGQADKARLDPSRRRSAILADDAPVRAWFLPKVEELIARERVLDRLGMAPFPVGTRELQVTRHVQGGFYRIHRDAGMAGDRSATRTLTYVYYFHRTPRMFSGGDILLFDHGEDGDRCPRLGFTRLAPDDDTLVFFASNRLHTVTPVSLPSDDPMDGRWTVNGWLHTNA